MLTATGCGLSVPPLGAHHGPPLGGTSNTTSSGRGCLFSISPALRISFSVEDGNHCYCIVFEYIENLIRKPPGECPPNILVYYRIP